MIDIDWFIEQSSQMIKKTEYAIETYERDEAVSAYCMAAFGMWLNVRLMQSAELVALTDEQQYEVDYIKMKLVQFSAHLPEGSDKAALA